MQMSNSLRCRYYILSASMLFVLLVSVSSLEKFFRGTVEAKEKDHTWRNGKLTDVSQRDASRLVEGTTHERTYWTYTVDDRTYVWKLDRDTRRRDKPLNVTINADVEFAIEGQDAYLKDEQGEAHKLSVQTKALKQQ